jgi:hypothetical protein
MSVQLIDHKGQEIVYVDYRMNTTKQMDETLKKSVLYAKKYKEKGEERPFLIDVRGVSISKEFGDKLSKGGKEHSNREKRSAIVGVTGLKRILFEAYLFLSKSRMRSFLLKDAALDFLTEK